MANGAQYATTLTATSSGSQCVVFYADGTTTIPLKATTVKLYNVGSSSLVFCNVTTTSGASTGDYPLRSTKDVTFTSRDGFYTGCSIIAAASTSSSVIVDVLAYR